jgi:PilZ domain
MEVITNYLNHSWPTKRQAERVSFKADVCVNHKGRRLQGTSKDLSGGGICMVLMDEIATGTEIDVEIQVPEREPLRCRAVVRWSFLGEHGCEYLKLGPTELRTIGSLLQAPVKKRKVTR